MLSLKDANIQSRALLLHHNRYSGAIDLTVHTIEESGRKGESQLGAGRVLGIEEKAEIANILSGDSGQPFEMRDEHILSQTPYALAWWIPKESRTIAFRIKNDVIKTTIEFPSAIGIYCRGSLFFAVIKSGKGTRPKSDTPLYTIPLPNLYGAGTFCRGNANVPSGARADNISAWNDFVFSTTNTHVGRNAPLQGLPDPKSNENAKEHALVEVYQDAERNGGRFPLKRLCPMGLTLGEWMSEIDQRSQSK